jgi:hypothetical protein
MKTSIVSQEILYSKANYSFHNLYGFPKANPADGTP